MYCAHVLFRCIASLYSPTCMNNLVDYHISSHTCRIADFLVQLTVCDDFNTHTMSRVFRGA